jgi:hypothetical protein
LLLKLHQRAHEISVVVEQLTHDLQFEGSNPRPAL